MVAESPDDGPSPVDHAIIARLWRGRVPWTLEGLLEALSAANDACRDGLGHDAPFYMMGWVQDRYGGDLGFAHSVRFQQIAQFLHAHRERIAREGFAKSGGAGATMLSDHLLRALAEVEFTKELPDPDEPGTCRYELDADHVLAAAVRNRSARGAGS